MCGFLFPIFKSWPFIEMQFIALDCTLEDQRILGYKDTRTKQGYRNWGAKKRATAHQAPLESGSKWKSKWKWRRHRISSTLMATSVNVSQMCPPQKIPKKKKKKRNISNEFESGDVSSISFFSEVQPQQPQNEREQPQWGHRRGGRWESRGRRRGLDPQTDS